MQPPMSVLHARGRRRARAEVGAPHVRGDRPARAPVRARGRDEDSPHRRRADDSRGPGRHRLRAERPARGRSRGRRDDDEWHRDAPPARRAEARGADARERVAGHARRRQGASYHRSHRSPYDGVRDVNVDPLRRTFPARDVFLSARGPSRSISTHTPRSTPAFRLRF
eukprot:20196-Pelagococcus_subviridis.AAC.1